MNKVILMGRLVRDPEVRYGQRAEPLAVARYTLAVNRRFKRQGEQEADFIGCVAFGKAGEFAEKYFKKGQLVSIVGRLQVRSWEDREGKRNWTTEVVIEEQYFAEGKKDSGETRDSESHGAEAGNRQAENKPADAGNSAAGYGKQMNLAEQKGFYPIEESLEDDDLPF